MTWRRLRFLVLTVLLIAGGACAVYLSTVLQQRADGMSDLKVAKSEGLILFDVAAGQIELEQSMVQLKGSLKLGANGMEIPAVLDLTMESTSRVKIK